jgi:hypothetical protein
MIHIVEGVFRIRQVMERWPTEEKNRGMRARGTVALESCNNGHQHLNKREALEQLAFEQLAFEQLPSE